MQAGHCKDGNGSLTNLFAFSLFIVPDVTCASHYTLYHKKFNAQTIRYMPLYHEIYTVIRLHIFYIFGSITIVLEV